MVTPWAWKSRPTSTSKGGMHDDQPATIAIERATGSLFGFSPLQVFIDGEPAGSVNRGRTAEFSVAAGEHLVAAALTRCHAGPVCLTLGPCERAELKCESNQTPLHPWHVHAFWCLVVYETL